MKKSARASANAAVKGIRTNPRMNHIGIVSLREKIIIIGATEDQNSDRSIVQIQCTTIPIFLTKNQPQKAADFKAAAIIGKCITTISDHIIVHEYKVYMHRLSCNLEIFIFVQMYAERKNKVFMKPLRLPFMQHHFHNSREGTKTFYSILVLITIIEVIRKICHSNECNLAFPQTNFEASQIENLGSLRLSILSSSHLLFTASF